MSRIEISVIYIVGAVLLFFISNKLSYNLVSKSMPSLKSEGPSIPKILISSLSVMVYVFVCKDEYTAIGLLILTMAFWNTKSNDNNLQNMATIVVASMISIIMALFFKDIAKFVPLLLNVVN